MLKGKKGIGVRPLEHKTIRQEVVRARPVPTVHELRARPGELGSRGVAAQVGIESTR